MSERTSSRRGLRLGLQLAVFLVGLGLLGWAVSIALREENRRQLERLGEASPSQVVSLLGLSLIALLISGLIFWVVLAPARRLKIVDVLAINSLATFVAYLPAKLSVVLRVAIHNRRDGVPILTIGAWYMAFTLSMGATVGALLLATLIHPTVDAIWAGLSLLFLAVFTTALIVVGRFFGFERGEARLHRVLDPITPPRWRHLLRGKRFSELHEGFAMLAHERAIAVSVALRVVDLLAQAARFVVAAEILGVELTFGGAILLALSYFVIGVIAPSGMLGVREMGTTAVASIASMASSESFAAVALLVTAAESIVTLSMAGLGLFWLRPDRLFTPAERASDSPDASDES